MERASNASPEARLMTNDSRAETHLPIYLDYCATTPVDPRVLEKMLPYLSQKFGNASSRDHSFGWDAQEAVENARGAVAHLVNASSADIYFTSGATESVNLAIKGAVRGLRKKGNHIITTAVEHGAVLETCGFLEHEGFSITYLPVDSGGGFDLRGLADAIRESTILISVMHANNETGVIFPVSEIGKIARENGVLLFTDATQTVGKIATDFPSLRVDCAAFSAHKIYGPKGAGTLYIGDNELKKSIMPLIHGGGQERGIRSGTQNVAAIVGFGEACRIAEREMTADYEKTHGLRNTLEQEIVSLIPGVIIHGDTNLRLPHICNMSFPAVEARELIRRMFKRIAGYESRFKGHGEG
jgi:cysteine desulfurase